METIDNNPLKARKEAFVTGHGGSNHPWEVLWVCSSVLWGCWLYAELKLVPQTTTATTTTTTTEKKKKKKKKKKKNSMAAKNLQRTKPFVMESCLVCLPIIVAQTHYLYPFGSLLMVGQIILAGKLYWKRTTTKKTQQQQQQQQDDEVQLQLQLPNSNSNNNNNNLIYLTLYRSSIYFLTFVAILAVDFPLFPRRFCKTEISGYGLMDVGAASFVFSSGIVHGKAYSKQQQQQQQQSKNPSGQKSNIPWRSLTRPLLKAAPLIGIGIIRCITNKELEYQEHVSEYGVHWNFFFTLGVLAVFPTIRRRILLALQQQQQHQQKTQQHHFRELVERWIFWAPLVGMVLYQYDLTAGRNDANGLEKFVLTAPRVPTNLPRFCSSNNGTENDDAAWHSLLRDGLFCLWTRFFYANREGILGCIGYFFLHAVGEWVGHNYVFVVVDNAPSMPASTSASTSTPMPTLPSSQPSLAKLAIWFWIALYSINYVFHVTASRRETNFSFCLWAVAHNLTLLWGFQIIAGWTTTTTAATSTSNTVNTSNNDSGTATVVGPAFGAVNAHGMASFLVANLLTGLVNLLVPTIDQGDSVAMIILIVYLSAVGGVALGLDHHHWKGGTNNNNKNNSGVEDDGEPVATATTKKTN